MPPIAPSPVPVFLFFAACGGALDSEAVSDPRDSTEAGETDSGAPAEWGRSYGVDQLEVAELEASFDLDGDGDPDNAVADAGRATIALLDATLAELLASATRVLILQVWALEDWEEDPAIEVGAFAGTKSASAGTVEVEEALLDDDGEVLIHVGTALVDGAYLVALADQALGFGDYNIEASTPVLLAGEPTEASQAGVLGFGLPTSAITTLAEASGYDSLAELAELADVDSDGDGSVDTVSMAFSFVAGAVVLQ